VVATVVRAPALRPCRERRLGRLERADIDRRARVARRPQSARLQAV